MKKINAKKAVKATLMLLVLWACAVIGAANVIFCAINHPNILIGIGIIVAIGVLGVLPWLMFYGDA